MEVIAPLILCLLSACSYLLPVSFFLPFKLKRKDKLILLLLFFVSILLIQWKLGNIGVIVLLFLAGFYIAWIDQNRFLNVCIFISTYLFCVVCDNLLSLVWGTVSLQVSGAVGDYGARILYFFLAIV